MEIQYDENLAANPFFREIRSSHPNIIDHASLQKLVLCIPRIGSLDQNITLNEDILLSHVLVPNQDLPETHFLTANEQAEVVLKAPKTLIFQTFVGGQVEVKILFEEIFYTKDFLKYKVWCIDRPFSGTNCIRMTSNDKEAGSPNELFYVHNLKDAIELIWTEVQSKHILRKIDASISNFKKNNRQFGNTDLMKLKNNTLLLYNHCVDMLLLNRKLKDKCKADAFFLKNLKVAVETYMINALYTHLFDAITLCTVDDNEKFNKSIRNLADIHLSDLNIDPKLHEFVPAMKLELIKIDTHTTVLDKLNCLKKALNIVSERYNKKMNKNKILTTDDVIPVLIFVLIKSGCRHWMTNLHFMKQFSFTDYSGANDFGAEHFLVVTLEAAMVFIMDNDIKIEESLEKSDGVRVKFNNKQDFLDYLFVKLKENDEDEVQRLLEPFNKTNGRLDIGAINPFFDLPALCHPLCDCPDCEKKLIESTPTINSRNTQGFTAIFIPVMYGAPKILTLLLNYSADVNVFDEKSWTPLHYAAARGHQNSLLLLLHAGADINAITTDMNTALHLSCLYGHANCTKALLYFSEHMKIKLAINAQNTHGDTALHMASKWGFLEMISALLENGARIDLANKFGHTPIQVAHSTRVVQIIHETYVVIPSFIKNDDAPHGVQNICLTDEDLMEDLNNLKVVSKIEKLQHLTTAIESGDTKAALLLLGLQQNKMSNGTCHPLCTCTKCHAIKAKSTNEATDNLDINEQNADGNTALHLAAISGNLNLTKVLLENGINETIVNKSQQTALHLAGFHSRYQIVKLLLKRSKFDILNAKDINGETVLMYAARQGDVKLVEAILLFEPQLNQKNQTGQSALEIAKENMFLGVVKLLDQSNISNNTEDILNINVVNGEDH